MGDTLRFSERFPCVADLLCPVRAGGGFSRSGRAGRGGVEPGGGKRRIGEDGWLLTAGGTALPSGRTARGGPALGPEEVYSIVAAFRTMN